MELIAIVVFAAPLGYFCRTRKQGLGLYLIAWAVIFPIQTLVVHHENADDISASYFIFNALFLMVGIGVNTFAARLRQRRAAPALEVTR